MVSPTPNAVPSESLLPVEAPESNVEEEIAGVAAAERVTVVVAEALRPSLASVPDAEPARLMSAVVLVVRLMLAGGDGGGAAGRRLIATQCIDVGRAAGADDRSTGCCRRSYPWSWYRS